jgi:hypothetical protein
MTQPQIIKSETKVKLSAKLKEDLAKATKVTAADKESIDRLIDDKFRELEENG